MFDLKTCKQILSWFVICELTLSPLAFAQSTAQTMGQAGQTLLQEGMGMMNSIQQQKNQQLQQQVMQQKINEFKAVIQPQPFPDKFFPQCQNLEAKSKTVGSDFSCSPETTPDPTKKYLYSAIADVAEDVGNKYSDFLVSPHGADAARQTNPASLKCFEDAGKKLQNDLKLEIEKVNQNIAEMKKQHEAFQLANKPIVEDIKLKDAILTGNNASKYLKDAKFDKLLADPACSTLYESSEFQDMGKKGGLAGIKETVIALGAGKDGGASGKYSAGNLLQTQSQLEAEIRKVAKASAEGTKIGDIKDIKVDNLAPTSAAYGLNSSPVLVKAVTEAVMQKDKDITELNRQVKKLGSLSSEQKELLNESMSEDIDLNQQIETYRDTTLSKCMNSSIKKTFGSMDKFTSKLTDKSISDAANNEGDPAFATEIQSIMDSDGDPSEKLAQIQKLEMKGYYSNYSIELGSTKSVAGQKFTASQKYRPSEFVKIWVNYCNQSFNGSTDATPVAPSKVIEQMKSLNSSYKNIASTFSSKVETSILNKMLNCTDNPTLGSANLSCNSADVLSPSNAGFCLSGAVKCAANMKSCEAKVGKVYDDTRKDQLAKAAVYRKNVEDYKRVVQGYADMYKKNVEGFMKVQAMYFNSLPFKGSPFELKLNNDGTYKMAGMDESLNMEDPEQYLKLAVANMEKLKTELDEHSKNVQAEVTLRQNTMKANYEANVKSWKDVRKNCANFVKTIEDQEQQAFMTAQQANTEQQSKISSFCIKADSYNRAPGCGDNLDELQDDASEVISFLNNDGAALGKLNEYKTMCANFNNEETNPYLDNSSESNYRVTVDQLCKDTNKPAECDDYNDLMTKYGPNGSCAKALTEDEVDLEDYCTKSGSTNGTVIAKKDGSQCQKGTDGTTIIEPTFEEFKKSSFYTSANGDCPYATPKEGRDELKTVRASLQTYANQKSQANAVKDMGENQISWTMCNSQNANQFNQKFGGGNTAAGANAFGSGALFNQ